MMKTITTVASLKYFADNQIHRLKHIHQCSTPLCEYWKTLSHLAETILNTNNGVIERRNAVDQMYCLISFGQKCRWHIDLSNKRWVTVNDTKVFADGISLLRNKN